ncbi:MAG TPA: ATP-binding protein [Phycisphaerae bacterium]|nr:ATP-binding protein [Phycisphaerae bacterium]
MKRRVIVCLILLLALYVLGNAIAMLSLHRSNDELRRLAESHRIQVMRANLASSGVRIETDLLAYRVGNPNADLKRRDSLGRFEDALNQCGSCHHSPPVQDQLDEVRGTFDSYVVALDGLIACENGDEECWHEREANLIVDHLNRQATAMADQAAYHVAVRSDDAAASVRMAWLILWGTLVAALAVGGVVAFHLARKVTGPIGALLEGVDRIRQGDDTHRFAIDADQEFQALADAFNDAYEDLKKAQESVLQAEKMAAVGKLAAGVAHEVGNPLASISSVAQMMRRRGQSPEQSKRIDLIMEHIGRINRIVRELLTFSRPPARENLSRIEVADLLDRAVTLLGYDKRARSIEITRHCDPGLGPVWADTDRLLLVFTNIIMNAFDALDAQPDGSPKLGITVVQEEAEVVVRFEDNGPGIAPEALPSVFEPFYTTKDPGAGTGLGLWVCYQVVEKHGGTIHMTSDLGNGTVVTVRLPSEPAQALRSGGGVPGDTGQAPGSLPAHQSN